MNAGNFPGKGLFMAVAEIVVIALCAAAALIVIRVIGSIVDGAW